ncbi:MAG: hypothetical protein JO055_12070 [Alphaproteobacteria bacterium]|nr:hypothetical protein [Alphaproteobacteria bacterium]
MPAVFFASTFGLEVLLMFLQAPSLLQFTGVAISHHWARSTQAATSAGMATICARVRRNRNRALQAAFLQAARNQQAPQWSNRRLLSQS